MNASIEWSYFAKVCEGCGRVFDARHRGAWTTHVGACPFVSEETKAALPARRDRGAA